MRILIAEDNVDSRELLHEILMTLGHEVVLAFDGVNALEKVAEARPDLCILDVDMPRKSGFEVVETLKGNPDTANIPIIMLTARGDVENRVRGLGLGADDYLAKPFNPRELLARVNTRLRAKAETDDLRQQQEIIQKTFSRYVAQEVIDYMLANPTQIQLGGQLRQVTVMFADLHGFTSMSEGLNPSDVLNILNRYHALTVSVIKRNGGTIDKFLGDGVMALFNAPIDLADHSFKAVKSALEIRSSLSDLHPTLPPEFQLTLNFGIHTGLALVGNVGASDIMDYTAVGDAVNLAARLEGMSAGDDIMISETVYEAVKNRVKAESLGLKAVKGRAEAALVYHVLGFLN